MLFQTLNSIFRTAEKPKTFAIDIAYLTIIPRARVGYEMVNSQFGATRLVGYNDLISDKREWNNFFIKEAKELQYFSSQAVFVDAYRLPYLWWMVYELIYHCLLTSKNAGIAIYHC